MKKIILFLCISVCLSVFGTLQAQHTNLNQTFQDTSISLNYVKSYATDTWKLVKSPFKWKARQWVYAVGFTGVVVGLVQYDDNIRAFFQRNKSPFTDNLSKYVFDPYGYGLYSLPALGGMYIIGEINNNKNLKSIALTGVKVFVITGLAGQFLKQVFHRHRPHQDLVPDPKNWDGPFSRYIYRSFPSLHTASSFAMAAYFSKVFNDKNWVKWVSYSFATFTGLSRINDDKHWASDVFAGAVLGYLVGSFVVKINRTGNSKLSLGYSVYGISLKYKL